MLSSLGRGLSPASSEPGYRIFSLTSSLPYGFAYTRSDTVATYRDSSGKLRAASSNQPRFDHDASGNPLGVLIEGTRQNKITLYNASPADTSGLTVVSGSPVLSVSTDAAALAAAGLDQIGNGSVIRIDNSASGTNTDIDIAGQTGNTNPHSFSLWARCTAGLVNYLKRSGSGSSSVPFSNTSYQRVKMENETPSASTNTMRINVKAGDTAYILLMQVEEGAFCSGEIVTSGAAATRQADSLTVSSLNAKLYYRDADGFLAARYRPYVLALSSADQYPASVHDGSTSNSAGIRLNKTDKDLQANYRGGGSPLFSLSNDVLHFKGHLQAGGISWSASEARMVQGGILKSLSLASGMTGVNKLQVGGRNGGNEPLWGHVESVALGRRYKTPSGLGGAMYKSGDILAVGAGQSLMVGHFSSQATGSAGGRDKFIETVGGWFPRKVAVFANGATGGSAACYTSSASNYWWKLADGSRGPAFTTFYAAIADAGIAPTAIFWAQGEADSHYIGGVTSRANYKAALQAIFADMRANLGDIPVIIQRIGRRTAGYSNTGGIQAVREVQQEMIDENSWCHGGSEVYDLGLYTGDGQNVHLDDAGYVTAGLRDSRKLLAVLGESIAGADGPRMTGASRSGTAVTVTIAHDGGTDFTPASGIEGFKFFDGSTAIAVTAAVRTNATTVTLTLASAPSGVETLYYGYDDMASLNTANVLKDNASVPMPLRTGKVVL